jgi:hypothetical protein
MEFAMTATLLENCFCLAAISEPKGRFLFSLAGEFTSALVQTGNQFCFQETKRDSQLQDGTSAKGTRELETRPDLSGALPHVVNTPMARLSPAIHNCWINAFPIVPNRHFKFTKVIRQLDLDLRAV